MNTLSISTNEAYKMILKKKSLLIYGAGSLGQMAGYYFQHDSNYELIGFADAIEFVSAGSSLLEKPVITWEQAKKLYSVDDIDVFVAIGYRKSNSIRQKRYEQVVADGYQVATYISSKAVNMASKIGANCFILESNVLQPYTNIGNNVIMWSGNHLGHHSVVEDNCFITSHVVVSGKCRIGANSFIGVNACIRDGISIGEKSVVGAGSIVMKDCGPRSVFSPMPTESRTILRDVI